MTEAPTGTVTLLFTDIEGSTKLLQQAGDAYADLLARHRELLRSAFAAQGGFEAAKRRGSRRYRKGAPRAPRTRSRPPTPPGSPSGTGDGDAGATLCVCLVLFSSLARQCLRVAGPSS